MADIIVKRVDSVNVVIKCDSSIRYELNDFFSFRPPGYQFHPRYKCKVWDGYVRIYRLMSSTLYTGLLPYLLKFAAERDYSVEVDPALQELDSFTPQYIEELAKKTPFEPRDYQVDAAVHALKNRRALLLSPTASGKSFIIYLMMLHHLKQGNPCLVIVPTIGLVGQMANDFVEYGCDPKLIHTIQGGSSKNVETPIVISTWHSITKLPKAWFNQFDVIFGDEAHLFQAKSLTTIMEKSDEVDYRYGLTGTLGSDSKCHKLVLEGLFGSVYQVEKTINLINDGTLAKLKVRPVRLIYPESERKETKGLKYPQEREWIFKHPRRNKFIKKLVSQFKDENTLILFDLVEKHGMIMEPILRELESKGFKVHFLHGGNDVESRQAVRRICESSVNNIILASSGIFSTGVNIKRLHRLIMAAGNTSRVTILQSIGRLLRKGGGADDVVCYDIGDDLNIGSWRNYTFKHFKSRTEVYMSEHFDVEQFNVEI